MGRREFVQVVVWSKRCTEVPIERVPYVNRVVPATAGNAEGEKKERIYALLHHISKSKKNLRANLLLGLQNIRQPGIPPSQQHTRPINNRSNVLSLQWIMRNYTNDLIQDGEVNDLNTKHLPWREPIRSQS